MKEFKELISQLGKVDENYKVTLYPIAVENYKQKFAQGVLLVNGKMKIYVPDGLEKGTCSFYDLNRRKQLSLEEIFIFMLVGEKLDLWKVSGDMIHKPLILEDINFAKIQEIASFGSSAEVEVTLKNGSTLRKSLVNAIMSSLKSLWEKDRFVIEELIEKIHNPDYQLGRYSEKELKEHKLIQSDGTIHSDIQNVVLLAVEGEGSNMRLTSPFKETSSSAIIAGDSPGGIKLTDIDVNPAKTSSPIDFKDLEFKALERVFENLEELNFEIRQMTSTTLHNFLSIPPVEPQRIP